MVGDKTRMTKHYMCSIIVRVKQNLDLLRNSKYKCLKDKMIFFYVTISNQFSISFCLRNVSRNFLYTSCFYCCLFNHQSILVMKIIPGSRGGNSTQKCDTMLNISSLFVITVYNFCFQKVRYGQNNRTSLLVFSWIQRF